MKTITQLFDEWADESVIYADAGVEQPTFLEYVRVAIEKERHDQELDEAIRDAVALNETLPPVEEYITEEELLRAAEAEPSDAYVRTTPAPAPRPVAVSLHQRRSPAVRPRERHAARRRLTRAGPDDDDPHPLRLLAARIRGWWSR